jgi:hypothetical protein
MHQTVDYDLILRGNPEYIAVLRELDARVLAEGELPVLLGREVCEALVQRALLLSLRSELADHGVIHAWNERR